MTLFSPIMLSGGNLGQRHRELNSLVHEALESGASFHEVETQPEQSPVDRIFKIDLAVKLKNREYIILNLKNDDMLFVSRALKATWLLDHHDIINPKYLENVLFPLMVTPAVTKMKHWLYINLRDPAMCQEFYQHYKDNTFEFAIKFLSHCTHEFILDEVPKVLSKISTHFLKVLCEKCPKVAKIYFDSLATDEDVKIRYLKQDQNYYNSVKCVLKSDTNLFLDITEKYFNLNGFSRFSPLATDYILRCYKTRIKNKLELYVAYFLHIPTLAARLSVDECQEVVLKLARASYLQHRFQYKVVEPLIKRLSPNKRAAFKKRVFVEKDVGECVQEWPYPTPQSPSHYDHSPHIFDDENFWPVNGIYNPMNPVYAPQSCLYHAMDDGAYFPCESRKPDLDRLFDDFRFIGFNRALHDLGQRLVTVSSADRRRDIFLVLVSKTGGRSEAVSALLRLAARHKNEPPHMRASILRSLVKRANVWRLPADAWQQFLDFGHGLGLDGATPEAECREGLHAVVIRQFLCGDLEPAVAIAFLKDFSSLAEYSLKVEERLHVAVGLQNMLAAAAVDVDPSVAAVRLAQLLDVLEIYRIRVEPTSSPVKAVMALATRDAEVARPLLERLYRARIARRELLRHNMEFRKDEAALLNALRHDPTVLEHKRVVETLLAARGETFDKFYSKLVVYFNQKQDFTTHFLAALKEKIAEEENVLLARPLASIMYNSLETELREFDEMGKDRVKFAAALRACAHRARPVINLARWGWRKAGVKAVATQAMRCRETERASLTRALAAERRTVRVALALSMRSAGGLLLETFASAAKLRPVVALQVALPYFRRQGASADVRVWDIVKPLLSSVDLSCRERLRLFITKTEWIPHTIKPDYCGTLYLVIDKFLNSSSGHVLRELCMILPEVKGDMIENILLWLLEKPREDVVMTYPAIFVRYLMLSTNNEDCERRFTKIGDLFLEHLESQRCEEDPSFLRNLNQVKNSLKYNAAFLDIKYTSCLSVIERFLAWMLKFMPREEYFDNYVQIHLTMLYFKAVRQSMKQSPEVFADPKRRKSEGVETVGFVFGKYIAKEVGELVRTYFDSITELYSDALINYLQYHFYRETSKAHFTGSLLKGILADGVGIQRRMAIYIIRHPLRLHAMDDNSKKEIEELISNDKTIELFVHNVYANKHIYY